MTARAEAEGFAGQDALREGHFRLEKLAEVGDDSLNETFSVFTEEFGQNNVSQQPGRLFNWYEWPVEREIGSDGRAITRRRHDQVVQSRTVGVFTSVTPDV